MERGEVKITISMYIKKKRRRRRWRKIERKRAKPGEQ